MMLRKMLQLPPGSADVFYTCIRALPYEVPYTFISFDNVSIDDLVQKVYNEEIDAVIGDSTMLANRSEYVDFIATYIDLGDFRLWLAVIFSLIFNALVVSAIELTNPDSEISLGRVSRMSFLFSILFSQNPTMIDVCIVEDRFSSNPSKFVMFVLVHRDACLVRELR
uniref:Ionotropic glutamate receptor C-terminal domain-containing protein n=1 Tax=Lactuca sativa TaxID=4236 RepID=A0A9R1UUL1_LACSA|nr:hypothetical protein LSAT_V11C800427580 [Lactuca sativa]